MIGICRHCGKEFQYEGGRRRREFCDNKGACRNAWHRANKPQKVKVAGTVELPKDFIGFDKIALVKADGTIEELKTPDQLPESWRLAERAIKELKNDMADFGVAVYHTDTQTQEVTRIDPLSEKAELLQQIAAIHNEKIPKERDTSLGRKVWQIEKNKKISELQEKLKTLTQQ